MLTFAYDANDTDDDTTANTYTDENDMYTVITLAQECLTPVLKINVLIHGQFLFTATYRW